MSVWQGTGEFLQIVSIPNFTPHLLSHGIFNTAVASACVFLLPEQQQFNVSIEVALMLLVSVFDCPS